MLRNMGLCQFPTGASQLSATSQTNGDKTFTFLWKETCGPTVSAPKRKGFGSAILLDGAKQFGAHVALNYEPEGLHYELRLPLSAVEATNKA